jgi:hypothetical protein
MIKKMLHKINIPKCSNNMKNIVEFQYHILRFACNLSCLSDLEEDSLVAEFDYYGKWLYKKLWKKEEGGRRIKTEFCEELIALNDYIRTHPDKKSIILDAFSHDIEFSTHLDDPTFKFNYVIMLDDLTRDAMKPLMIAFYEFLDSGFTLYLNGNQFKINRDTLIASFYESNPKLEVCPACDGSRPDKVNNKIYADADHFLPKSKYPFLSIHPANIVPLCLDCNRLFKLNFDPIDDHNDAPLVNSFHPYCKCAIEYVDIKVVISDTGVKRIVIKDKDGMPSRRVNNLNNTFKLEQRWQDRLRQSVDSIIDELRGAARRINRCRVDQIKSEDLKIELEDMLMNRARLIGQRQNYVLHKSYLDYALEDANEFESLLELFAS